MENFDRPVPVLDLKHRQTRAHIAAAKPNKETSVSLMFEGDRSGRRIVGQAKRSHDGESLDVYVAGELSHDWRWNDLKDALAAHL